MTDNLRALAGQYRRQGNPDAADLAEACIESPTSTLPSQLAKVLRFQVDRIAALGAARALRDYADELRDAGHEHRRELERLDAHHNLGMRGVMGQFATHRQTAATLDAMEAEVRQHVAQAEAKWQASAAVLISTTEHLKNELREWGVDRHVGE